MPPMIGDVKVMHLGFDEPLVGSEASELEEAWRPTTTEEMFPQWRTARIILQQWIDGIDGLEIEPNEHNPHQLVIGLSARQDLLSLVPPEDQRKAAFIVINALESYIGRKILVDCGGKPNTQHTSFEIAQQIQTIENERIVRGEGSLKESLARALGLLLPLAVKLEVSRG